MTPQEQHLIEDLFTRLKSVSTSGKDDDAAQFIRTLIARFPDAPYYLTQNVLVQQQALERADERIRELEDLNQRSSAAAPRAATSFLGGAPSVPSTGRRPANEPDAEERQRESPWSQPSQQSRSGSFLSSALSTATGVAGGMFLAESIRSLFGGGSGNAVAGEKQAALDRAQDQAQDAEDDAAQARKDLAADDAALDDMQDQQDDDDGWSDDDGSLDI